MARILSVPFRLTPAGRAATVEQHSADGRAEQLAVLLRTRRGERSLVPAFGVPDPAFSEVTVAQVAAAVAMFGPPVTIEDVVVDYPAADRQEVIVTYE